MADIEVKQEGGHLVLTIWPWGEAPLALADARKLARQLNDVLRAPPNCIHGFGPKEPCYRCKQETL